ncbi:DUF4198 domain-containing protein [Chitinimonas naiadis]
MKLVGMQLKKSVALLGVAATVLAPSVLAHGGPYLLPTQFAITRDYVSVQGAIGNEVFFIPQSPIRNGNYYSISPAGARVKLEGVTTLKDYVAIEAPVTEKGTYRLTTGDDLVRTSKLAFVDGSWRMVRPANMGGQPSGQPAAQRPAPPAGANPQAAALANPAAGAPATPPARPRFVEESALTPDMQVVEVKAVSKAETYVSKGAPSVAATKPSGQGFELWPITHPNDIYVDQGFEFELLEDGKPLPNVAVEIARAGNFYDEKKEYAELKTDDKGRGKVKFDAPGAYILLTNYPAAQRDRAAAPAPRSYSYSLTFEVMR